LVGSLGRTATVVCIGIALGAVEANASPSLNAAPVGAPSPSAQSQPVPGKQAEYYPDRANRANRGGVAELRCTVTAEGGLAGCVVLREEPTGYGFGAAALAMARGGVWKVRPKTVDGTPTAGGFFERTIVFRPAPAVPRPTAPPNPPR